jgi:tripartite-type tricarboxylate transporter receptor subunit TctC
MQHLNFARILGACAAIAAVTGNPVQAQNFPSKPITLIVPWTPGGAIDGVCRAIAPKLAERLGQPVVIEHRAGAGATIGTAAVARATPDGHTLVMAGSASLALAPTIFKKLPYDPAKDFTPIFYTVRTPFALVVHPSLPVKSVADLIKLAKEKPGYLNYGSGGPGSPHHLYTELFKSMTGVELTHVPYKGSAPALNDVVAGHIHLMFSDPLPVLPQIEAGTVRALGVSSIARWATAPNIPTIAETLPGFDAVGWGMIVAPAGTPKEIVERLHAELKAVTAMSEVEAQISNLGMFPVASPSVDELQKFINTEIERWAKVVRQAGLAATQ